MVKDKELTKLNFKFQEYLNYINIIWTIAISLFIAVMSYIMISWQNIKQQLFTLITLEAILIFVEIAFLAALFWITKKKNNIKQQIENIK